MGINLLWKFIKDHKQEVVTNVDLVERAKTCHESKMNVMIDFYNFQFYLKDKVTRSLSQITDNSQLMFAAGEYKLMDKALRCFIEEFRNVNVEPVFYLDAARGSGAEQVEPKLPLWRRRYFSYLGNMNKVFQFLNGKIPITEVKLDLLARPCLQEIQNIHTLQELKCQMVFNESGEADVLIGKSAKGNEQAFIISGDTDFLIFPGGNLLPLDFFDLNGQLCQDLSSFEAKVPKNVVCGMICSADITKLLKLQSQVELIEVATIAGNDFTKHLLIRHKEYRNLYMGQFVKLAQLIKTHRTIEQCDFFGALMLKNDNFGKAVLYSRQFYSLQLPEEQKQEDGSLFQKILANIRQGKVPSTILSMYRGRYWRRLILEDPVEGMPVAEDVMSELRAFLYQLVLPRETDAVVEIGRTMENNFTETQVQKSSDVQFPSLQEIQENSTPTNLNLFERILTHKDCFELKDGQSYFKDFGMKKGFVCLLLRYFLLVNWNINLCLNPREVFALIAWTVSDHNVEEYLKLNILPTSRCLTLQSWMQNLYRIAYAFLGNVLDVSQEFPSPKEMFSASAWVVLYTSSCVNRAGLPAAMKRPLLHGPGTSEDNEQIETLVCPTHVPIDEMRKANKFVLKTLEENEVLVKQVIDGFFLFNLNELKATDWAYG